MQVSQSADHVTHVTVSKNKAMDFSFDDSAHLAHILSTALYSNPRLAMIRETICNMWDAHIDAGKTDIPGSITLRDNVLIIRDFGKGIHPDKIQKIYCVYGGSTKTNDSGVTGGFGLGCKSPWAYVDHFQVSSYHEGTKTIYKASKSSAEVNGKPSMLPIISMPCGDESGLEVKIEIKRHDESYIMSAIRSVVFNGEISATLNDELLPTLPLSQSKHGFFITTEPLSIDNASIALFVRYGNVIYPLEAHESTNEMLQKAVRIVRDIPAQGSRYSSRAYRLVVMAEPDSLSIMPSREGLSMSELTVNTVNKILKDFCENFYSKLKPEFAAPVITELHKEVFAHMNPIAILAMKPGHIARMRNDDDFTNRERIEDNYTLNRAMLLGSLSESFYPNIILKEYKWRINRAIRGKLLDRKLATAFRNQLTTTDNNTSRVYYHGYNQIYSHNNWIVRHHFWPIIKAAQANPKVNLKHLKVYAHNIYELDKNGWRNRHRSGLVELKDYTSFNIDAQLNFLRKFIVIGHNTSDITDAIYEPELKKHHQSGDFLTYVIPRNTKKKDEIVQFFKDLGYQVIDNCREVERPVVAAGDPTKAVPKKVGIPTLTSMKAYLPRAQYETIIAVPTANRVAKPEAVTLIRKGDGQCDDMIRMPTKLHDFVIKEFGDVIGIAVTTTQRDKYMQKGAMNLNSYLAKKMFDHIMNSKTICAVHATNPHHPMVPVSLGVTGYVADNVADMVLPMLQHEDIQKKYRLHTPKNELDVVYYELWKYMKKQHIHRYSKEYVDEIQAVEAKFARIKPCERMIAFMQAFRKHEVLNKIDEYGYQDIFSGDLAPQGVKLITTFIESI